MQKIFEEYGGVIQVCMALIALIAIVAIIVGGTNGGIVGESLNSFVKQLSSSEDNGGSGVVVETSDNVMMALAQSQTEGEEEAFTLWAQSATRVEFKSSYPETMMITNNPAEAKTVDSGYALDISEAKNGSVVAYLATEGEDVVLYIAGKDGVVMANENSFGVFARLNVKEINFNGNYNTSLAQNMSCMFGQSPNLETLDLSGFDTSNVTNMYALVAECGALKSIDVSGFDTSKVTNMGSMFNICSSLEEVDLTSFDTSNATDMSYMFNGCESMSHIYVGDGWSVSQATKTRMFNNCGVSTVENK